MALPIIKLSSQEEYDLFSNGGILLEKIKGADGLNLSSMDRVIVKFGSLSESGKIETINVKGSSFRGESNFWPYHNVEKLVLIALGKKVNIARS
ncbi:MAG: hypothetical protein FWC61_00015 [Proteobacteria bacterium]|nr:hypothetical protein [Pseudomonadota bacterium]